MTDAIIRPIQGRYWDVETPKPRTVENGSSVRFSRLEDALRYATEKANQLRSKVWILNDQAEVSMTVVPNRTTMITDFVNFERNSKFE